MTKSGKHCGKRRNCSFWAISTFVTMFLKSRLLQRCQKVSIWGKGLISWKHCGKIWLELIEISKNILILGFVYGCWTYMDHFSVVRLSVCHTFTLWHISGAYLGVNRVYTKVRWGRGSHIFRRENFDNISYIKYGELKLPFWSYWKHYKLATFTGRFFLHIWTKTMLTIVSLQFFKHFYFYLIWQSVRIGVHAYVWEQACYCSQQNIHIFLWSLLFQYGCKNKQQHMFRLIFLQKDRKKDWKLTAVIYLWYVNLFMF